MSTGKLFILSAPSGTGKTTILKRVMADLEGCAFSISHTTRSPRQGETDGVEYHFIHRAAFEEMIESGEFFEYAEVHGNLYGTSRTAVQHQLEQGKDVILDIDVQGADIIRKVKDLEAVYIFLAPPNLEELEKRLRGRGLDDEETITLRLANARREMMAIDRYEYLIVNETVEESVRLFSAVILAERARSRRDSRGRSLRGIQS